MNVVAHNLLATNTNIQFNKNAKKKEKISEKLSSGYQINRSADDAAGLSISEKMRNQIRNLNQATNNVEDGISVCQVADGALSEITSIIHRLEELSVRAANDVLAKEDREACDEEMQELLGEIDKVGHDTQFNGIPLFRGRDVEVGAPGTKKSDLTPDKLELGYDNLRLGTSAPFQNDSSGNTLKLGVSGKANSDVAGATWKLIFGDGGTSHPSIRLKWENPATGTIHQNIMKLENGTEKAGSYSYDSQNQTYSRTLSLCDMTLDKKLADGTTSSTLAMDVTETVKLVDNGNDKYYEISYKVKTTTNDLDLNLKYDFMYNCDTAYNNNDRCEGYYIGGQRVTKSTLYTTDSELLLQGNSNVLNKKPNDFSICNLDAALGFTETVGVGIGGSTPDTISLGRWTEVDKWDYYDDLQNNLGNDIVGKDLAFSFIWNENLTKSLGAGSVEKEYMIKQGIAATEKDKNIQGISWKYDDSRLVRHESTMPMYIQSGANSGENMQLEFREVNQETTGVYGMNCLTREDAVQAMEQVREALRFTNDFRSAIGAKQNRLENTLRGNMNYSENLTSAESLIRDTDMSTAMTEFSKQNVLMQAAQSMLSQANSAPQGVLQLLQ